MEQADDPHPFFISRNVENDPLAKSDDEEGDKEKDFKSGKYIKFFCQDEQRWKDNF